MFELTQREHASSAGTPAERARALRQARIAEGDKERLDAEAAKFEEAVRGMAPEEAASTVRRLVQVSLDDERVAASLENAELLELMSERRKKLACDEAEREALKETRAEIDQLQAAALSAVAELVSSITAAWQSFDEAMLLVQLAQDHAAVFAAGKTPQGYDCSKATPLNWLTEKLIAAEASLAGCNGEYEAASVSATRVRRQVEDCCERVARWGGIHAASASDSRAAAVAMAELVREIADAWSGFRLSAEQCGLAHTHATQLAAGRSPHGYAAAAAAGAGPAEWVRRKIGAAVAALREDGVRFEQLAAVAADVRRRVEVSCGHIYVAATRG